MPRNSGGVYVQPPSDVNPPVFGQPIDPVAFAAAIVDIGNEITGSLDRLGRASMQAPLPMGGFRITNVGAPVAQNDGARLADFSNYLPAGAVQLFGMNTAPVGWLACDGLAYSRATFAALFAAIGTTWGAGDGSSTFNVPDLRGVFPRGWDNGKGLDPARVFASYAADMLAAHTHIQDAHSHTVTDPGHAHGIVGGIFPASGGGNNVTSTFATTTAIATTGITIADQTATNQMTGGVETAPKNIALLFAIRT